MNNKMLFFLSVLFLSLLPSSACNPETKTTKPTIIQKTNTPQPVEVTLTLTPTFHPTKTNAPQATLTPSLTQIPTLDHFSRIYPFSVTEYIIPLSVRHLQKGNAIFYFELEKPLKGKLVYRDLDTRIQREIAFSDDQNQHMINVDDLTPGTKYEAQIMLGTEEYNYQQPSFEKEAWGPIRYRSTSREWPIRIGVIGDASFGDDATQKLVKMMAIKNLDFVIHTGDVVYEIDGSNPLKSYAHKFFQPFAPLLHQVPIYTVLGNHDYDSSLRLNGVPTYDYAFPAYPDPIISYPEARRGNQYYAFNYQDIQFLMLDTHVFAGAEGREAQDDWIDERLVDPQYRITIPVFHVAPYSSSVVHPNDGLPVRLSWNWRFEQAKVPLVLSGHFHHYERLIANGITYIVTGGGSSTLYAKGETLNESEFYARKTHFVLLEIYENQIKIAAISLDGEILDQTLIDLE